MMAGAPMIRVAALWRVLLFIVAIALSGQTGVAQQWNGPRAVELARRAIERRSGQIADSSLAAYHAKANGYLTFLVQVGDTAILPAVVVRQDQLAVEVYWRAPGSSKQIVVGRRDTLLMPADIDYYRDRFGIVQSNFPDHIRMGDGRDVADVPHPFGPAGLQIYDFAITDSLSLQVVNERFEVYQVAFRPKNPSQARAIGSAFLDVREADIVRLELAFTRPAILDKRIEHLTVFLENALIEGRFWLPQRQHVEVVRAAPDFSVPVRGIIRGWWDVCCYDVTFAPPPNLFAGPPISFAPQSALRSYPFEGNILDGLPPEIAATRPGDITDVQERAESLVGQEFRERAQRAAFAMPRTRDLVRVTRAEGLALGAAARLRLTTGVHTDVRTRYGFSDEEWKGEVGVRWDLTRGRAIRAFAMRDYVDVRDVPETSGIRNSIAAQEFGSDYTDPVDVRAAGVELTLGRWRSARWRLDIAHESHEALSLAASPVNGEYEPLIPARTVEGNRVGIRAEGATLTGSIGTLRTNAELRLLDFGESRAARLSIAAEYSRQFGRYRLSATTVAAAVSNGNVPPQLGVYFGGPVTGPGYAFDDFAARRGVSQRVEWRMPVSFIPIALGRFGQVPGTATLVPFVHAVLVDDPLFASDESGLSASPIRGERQGVYPAVGIGLEPLMGLVRLDVARGLRDGRWTFSFDVARALWALL